MPVTLDWLHLSLKSKLIGFLEMMIVSIKVEELKPLETLERAYENYLKFSETEDEMPYLDTHCWTFMPSSFSLMM